MTVDQAGRIAVCPTGSMKLKLEVQIMTKVAIAEQGLQDHAYTLMDFLAMRGEDLTVVYVQDDQGRIYKRVELVRETLTDGSRVHNLVFS